MATGIMTGSRMFDGRKYFFYSWADSKKEADKIVKLNKNRMEKQFNRVAYARITKGKHPRTHKTRYIIWVRD